MGPGGQCMTFEIVAISTNNKVLLSWSLAVDLFVAVTNEVIRRLSMSGYILQSYKNGRPIYKSSGLIFINVSR